MRLLLYLALLICLPRPCAQLTAQESTENLYQAGVKPLLKKRCVACHGVLKQEAGLRVDTAAALKHHGIIESGDLLERVTSHDTEYRMPPEGEALTVDEIKLLKAWIDAGAVAPADEHGELSPEEHWAFQKITRPSIPAISTENPIDTFLQANHNREGLQPQAKAERTILIRRLYLDLVGLPPTLEQVRTEEPIDAIIDRLLDSPHHGERWARHWMDVWRYSDWYGLNKQLRNSQKHIWHWREWIVQSINEDKGYDQMIREMLAGDELAANDSSIVAATGFLARNYYLFNRTTWLDDTIEHTSKAFLGLTLNCAKCHDHKYDPISHEDYYRFRAIFEPHHVRLDALPGETDFERDGLPRVYDDNLAAKTYVHLRGNPTDPDRSKVIPPGPPLFLSKFAQDPQEISLPVESWAPGVRNYVRADLLSQAQGQVNKKRQRLQLLKERNKKEHSSKNASESQRKIMLTDHFDEASPEVWKTIGTGWEFENGKLVQTQPNIQRCCLRTLDNHPQDFEATVRFTTTGGMQWKSAGIRFDADDSGQNAHTVYASAYMAGPKVQISHTVAGKNSYPKTASINRAIDLGKEYELNIKVRGELINVALDDTFLMSYRLPSRRAGSIELFAFDAITEFDSIEVTELPESVAMHEANSESTEQVSMPIAAAELKLAEAKLAELTARIAADNLKFRGLGQGSEKDSARQTLLTELAAEQLALLSSKGDAREKIEKKIKSLRDKLQSEQLPHHQPVRGSQRALNQGSHKHSQYAPIYPRSSTGRRTALANWITHRDNPLTARVAVNHIWSRHFGAPLVESTFDFGRRCPEPHLKDLLDFLAIELIESGWSMKHIHRMIVTSNAWQRSSSNLDAAPSTLKRDPENRFLWRMNARRMESQAIRDSLLHLSKKLDLKLGGPSLKPGPTNKRRSLYLIHALDDRDQFVATFDDANVLACYRRTESIVPQQALAMMNSQEVVTAANDIASRFSSDLPDVEFVQLLFDELLARKPNQDELDVCLDFLQEKNQRSSLVHALLNHNDFQVIR